MLNAPTIAALDRTNVDPHAERRKRRLLAALWALFWVLMLAIAWQDNLDNPYVEWWEPLLWEGSSLLAGTAWLVLQLHLGRAASSFLDQPVKWFARHLKWFPPVAIVFIGVVYAMRHGVYALVGRTYEHESWGFILIYESIKLWLFLGLWLGIIFALDSFSVWQEQRRRLAMLQKSLAEAQLGQLKAQLRPHFLFNALNTISSLMQVDVARADRLMSKLAQLLRASLTVDQHELTTVKAEIELLHLYAEVMEERFAERVTLDWSIDESALNGLMPAMLLQPLLENAFKHGVERSSVPARIAVRVRRASDALEIAIENSGEIVSTPGEGIGLRNAQTRLNLHYGDAATFMFEVVAGKAVCRIRLPWQECVA
jgi:hypothetical protein